MSRPFYFQKRGIELATGLGWHPDGKRLLISYGVNQGEAWIATVNAKEVRAVLYSLLRTTEEVLGATSSSAKPMTKGWEGR
jgi:hypothetical protein